MNGRFLRLKEIAAVAAIVVFSACAGSPTVASSSPGAPSKLPPSTTAAASPSPDPLPSADPSPSPFIFPSPTPLPIGTPVARRVLAPATELPIVALCSYKVYPTADGNFTPLFCRSGALNAVAWKAYVQIGPHVMSLGRSATLVQVETAMCRDGKYLHATAPEGWYSYEVSSAYHGWKYADAISKWQYVPYDPTHPLC